MAIKKASRPSASAAPSKTVAKATGKVASKGKVVEEEVGNVAIHGAMGEIGTTASRTVRSGGEDVFVSVTAKYPFDASVDGADEEAYEKAVAFVDAKLTERLEGIPDDAANSEGEADEPVSKKKTSKKPAKKVEEPVEEDEDEDEDAEDEDAEDEDGDDDELTVEEIEAMDKKSLLALIDENELEIDKKLSLAKLRAAVIEALSEDGDDDADEDEDGEEDEDADEDEDEDEDAEDEDEDGDDDADDDEPYTKEQLSSMKLEDLIQIADVWEVDAKIKKADDLKTKKAKYIKAILADQEAQQAE